MRSVALSLLFAHFFPVAVWYGGGKARAPMLEADPRAKTESWRGDLRQIRSLGFNSIRCWMDWASGEPAEKQYRLETLDVLLELAGQEGLKVILQVYMDSAPAWVGRKFPDARFVSANGERIEPESAPGYCADHPGVRAAEAALPGRAVRAMTYVRPPPHADASSTSTSAGPNARYSTSSSPDLRPRRRAPGSSNPE